MNTICQNFFQNTINTKTQCIHYKMSVTISVEIVEFINDN